MKINDRDVEVLADSGTMPPDKLAQMLATRLFDDVEQLMVHLNDDDFDKSLDVLSSVLQVAGKLMMSLAAKNHDDTAADSRAQIIHAIAAISGAALADILTAWTKEESMGRVTQLFINDVIKACHECQSIQVKLMHGTRLSN